MDIAEVQMALPLRQVARLTVQLRFPWQLVPQVDLEVDHQHRRSMAEQAEILSPPNREAQARHQIFQGI